ncbi:sugar transferase [Ascidiimonas sp. W6]|uniref:sugar transferase n=1 Tax=Ascidiimonas meishanensis TaxID=3128903 RepID=UPI0030ECA779
MYRNFLKRVFDFFAALIGLLIVSPIAMIIYVILWFTNDKKPLFLQPRPGKNEKIFTIYKFKTMTDKTDADGNLLPDHMRVTRFGTFLRKSSLDEIPQLLNIVKGDMSLVGPRPLRVRYLPYYTKKEQIRHSIRPGVTGLAQVSGRNLLSWDEKLAKDISYVENLSLWLDVKILLKTVLKVIQSQNIELAPASEDLDAIRKKT